LTTKSTSLNKPWIQERKMKKQIAAQTCFDCQHGMIEDGYDATREEPGQEASAECSMFPVLPSYFDTLFERNGDPAPYCRYFKPQMIEKCPQCHAPMDQPAWSWQIHAQSIHGPVAVCSTTCQLLMDAKLRGDEAQLMEDLSIETPAKTVQWKIANSRNGAVLEGLLYPDGESATAQIKRRDPWEGSQELAGWAIAVLEDAVWLPDPKGGHPEPTHAWQTHASIFRSPYHPYGSEGSDVGGKLLYGYFDGNECLSQSWLTKTEFEFEQAQAEAATNSNITIVQMLKDDCQISLGE
jgi:hypothetical protein